MYGSHCRSLQGCRSHGCAAVSIARGSGQAGHLLAYCVRIRRVASHKECAATTSSPRLFLLQCFYTIMTVFMGTGFNFGPTYCSRLAVFFKQRDHRFYKPAGGLVMTPARSAAVKEALLAIPTYLACMAFQIINSVSADHAVQRQSTLRHIFDRPPCITCHVPHATCRRPPARPQPGAPPS